MPPPDLDLTAAYDHEVAAFERLLRGADLEAVVPSCPGWTVARLTDHLGRVHRNVCQMLADPTPESGRWAKLPHAPEGPAIIEWFVEGARQLAADLEAFTCANAADATADAEETRVPTWAGLQPPTFWPRRMAHEAAVHRWDLEAATAPERPATALDPALATDGIDEYFEVFVTHRLAPEAIAGLGACTFALVATDVGRSWRVGADGSTVRWDTAGPTAADLVLTGSASDLLLFLWNRVGVDGLAASGPRAAADRWHEHVRF